MKSSIPGMWTYMGEQRGRITKVHGATFEGNRYTHYLDWGDGLMHAFISYFSLFFFNFLNLYLNTCKLFLSEGSFHWKRPWCWERLQTGGEGDDRGRDGWMASPTRWTWVWASSGSWSWTGRPGVLWFMGVTKCQTWLSNWTHDCYIWIKLLYLNKTELMTAISE